jgi:ABC-2 type transport system ATP-binding protein
LIKCLATLLDVDGGSAFVNGYDVTTHPDEVRLSINLVGSGHWVAFDWGLTLRQNLHFFGSLYGMSKTERQQRIEAALELLGLTLLAEQTPRNLSSGERQRMLLAKGFMVRAPIFFLDEPTVGLDPQGAREVRAFLKRELLGNSGRSGILTTHRLVEAEELCSRIAIMHQGRIVATGTPLELKRLAGQHEVLEVRAAATPSDAIELIGRLRGVKHAALTPAGEESVEELLRVHCEDADALAGAVVDLLRRSGARVSAVEPRQPTLEDAFIALTSDNETNGHSALKAVETCKSPLRN